MTDKNISLIYHCLASNNQINYVISYGLPFNTETLLSCKPKNDIVEIETRNFHNFDRGKVNLDLELYDWSKIYEKSSGSEMLETLGLFVEKNYRCQCSISHKKHKSKTGNQKQKTMNS